MADDGIPKIAPQQQSKKGQKPDRGSQPVSQMTIREAMAAQLMAGIRASESDVSEARYPAEHAARLAIVDADALFAELEK